MNGRPFPVPDALSAGYWEHTAKHELALARCAQCSAHTHPPDLVCPHCGSSDPQWAYERVPGTGTVRTWTVVRRSFLAGFDAPFVLVDVELDVAATLDDTQNPRLIGRLIEGSGISGRLRLGSRVHVVFEDLAPGSAVPAFSLDEDA